MFSVTACVTHHININSQVLKLLQLFLGTMLDLQLLTMFKPQYVHQPGLSINKVNLLAVFYCHNCIDTIFKKKKKNHVIIILLQDIITAHLYNAEYNMDTIVLYFRRT